MIASETYDLLEDTSIDQYDDIISYAPKTKGKQKKCVIYF